MVRFEESLYLEQTHTGCENLKQYLVLDFSSSHQLVFKDGTILFVTHPFVTMEMLVMMWQNIFQIIFPVGSELQVEGFVNIKGRIIVNPLFA